MKTRVLMMLGAAAALASSVPAAPAGAAMMDMSKVDCTQSASMMMMKPPDAMMGDHAMGSPAPAMAMTTDAAFGSAMHTMMGHATMMAGMELKCGKDPAMRAMAAKFLQQLSDDGAEDAKSILNTYNH